MTCQRGPDAGRRKRVKKILQMTAGLQKRSFSRIILFFKIRRPHSGVLSSADKGGGDLQMPTFALFGAKLRIFLNL